MNFLQTFPNGCLTVTWSPGSSGFDGGYTTSVATGNFVIVPKIGGTVVSNGSSVRIDYIAIGW